jgi:hypothetical protein
MSSTTNVSIYDIESQEYEKQKKTIIPIVIDANMRLPQEIAAIGPVGPVGPVGPTAANIETAELVLRVTSRMKENEREIENDAAIILCGKSCIILLFIILVLPILICDMYYAYNDDSCVNEYPEGLSINMKDYLLGCSYTSIVVMAIIICVTCTASNENIKVINMCMNIWPIFILNLFSLIWHIIGASIFWGKLYPEDLCNKSPSTYFFISLIIKLLLSGSTFSRPNKKE